MAAAEYGDDAANVKGGALLLCIAGSHVVGIVVSYWNETKD